jgi:hypothetical protein
VRVSFIQKWRYESSFLAFFDLFFGPEIEILYFKLGVEDSESGFSFSPSLLVPEKLTVGLGKHELWVTSLARIKEGERRRCRSYLTLPTQSHL